MTLPPFPQFSAHIPAILVRPSSNGKFDFELHVQKELPQCEIHIFDFTDYSEQMKVWGVNGSYHAWGLKGKDGSVNNYALDKSSRTGGIMKTIDETVTELGHRGRMIEIFKIDCEGCEVRTKQPARKFRLLLVSTINVTDRGWVFIYQWISYKDWFDETAFQGLRQILVETHRLVGNSTHEFFQYLHDLGYVMFHKVCTCLLICQFPASALDEPNCL